ncbi:MAG: ferrous iron transport protein A [Acidobacteria bacterium]|nr:ferrous iron transport protein A [Acidobacteriota bacterium]
MTLDKLQMGTSARLMHIDSSATLRSRLLELGLTPGTDVSIVRVAPMGDPIEVKVRGYRLTLRKKDAALINCQKI